MKRLFTYINPIKFVANLVSTIKELVDYSNYSKIIKVMDEEGTIKEMGMKRGPFNSMIKGINLKPEILLYSDGMDDETSQEQFELSFVASELKKYNEILMKEGILNKVISEPKRVKTDDYYGYTVSIKYMFNKLKFSNIFYIASYITITTILLISIDYTSVLEQVMGFIK